MGCCIDLHLNDQLERAIGGRDRDVWEQVARHPVHRPQRPPRPGADTKPLDGQRRRRLVVTVEESTQQCAGELLRMMSEPGDNDGQLRSSGVCFSVAGFAINPVTRLGACHSADVGST
jgi:hypothetical protein